MHNAALKHQIVHDAERSPRRAHSRLFKPPAVPGVGDCDYVTLQQCSARVQATEVATATLSDAFIRILLIC
jgi:hypothetical protein